MADDVNRDDLEAAVRFVLCTSCIDTDSEKQVFAKHNLSRVAKLEPKLFRVVLEHFREEPAFSRVHAMMLDKVSSVDVMIETMGCTDRPYLQKLVAHNIAARLKLDGNRLTPKHLLSALTTMQEAPEMRDVTINDHMCAAMKSLMPVLEREKDESFVFSEIIDLFNADTDHYIKEIWGMFLVHGVSE